MQKIGLIGGLGPESTLDYYKRITGFFQRHSGGLATPDILIYSANLAEAFELMGALRWEGLADWLVEKLEALHQAGADFAAISANSPHIVFDRVAARSPLPLVSIVDATLAGAQRAGLTRVGLLGTRFTMEANFFGTRFAEAGIEVLVPSLDDQAFIQTKLEQEIELGIFRNETRRGLLDIIDRMVRSKGIQGVILGCTELPLILGPEDTDLPQLNTSELHVAALCDRCLAAPAQDRPRQPPAI